MPVLIDYISWPMESIYRTEFDNFIFESLEPSSSDFFIRRMANEFPDFSRYIVDHIPVAMGGVCVFNSIFDKYSKKSLEDKAKAFSYTMGTPEGKHVTIFKPDHSISGLPRDTYYIHLSPVPNLDINGIRCKASGRFEPYEPRIYMFPLYYMVDSSRSRDEQYDMMLSKCETIANHFNEVYLANGKITRPETYHVYLIQLPDGYPIYDDYSMEEPSVYVENNIPPANVRAVGTIEPPGSKPKYVKRLR